MTFETNYETMSDEELINAAPPNEEALDEELEETEELDEGLEPEETLDEELEEESNEEQEEYEDVEEPELDVYSKEDSDDSSKYSEDVDEEDGEDEESPEASTLSGSELEEFYRTILSPFKANGKKIAPRNAEEVIRLMQMGANYTKKMQEITPYRKTLLKLEKQGLLEDDSLNYLIDLHNKNPEAIKKLLRDSEYDPLEHGSWDDDEEGAEEYRPSEHYNVSDQEIAFDAAVDHVNSLEGGSQTISRIHTTWDDASKKVLWEYPELLEKIHTQISNGIYDQITQEIERMRVLGQIPAHASFLQAYKLVGDVLDSQGAFENTAARRPQPTAVTKRASRRANVDNEKRAKSASITRGKSKKGGGRIVDLSDTSDDEFLRAMEKML